MRGAWSRRVSLGKVERLPWRETLRISRRAFGLLAPFKGWMLALVSLTALTSALGLLPLPMLGCIVNEAVGSTDPSASGAPSGFAELCGLGKDAAAGPQTSRVTLLVGVLAALTLVSSLIGVLRTFVNQHVSQSLIVKLRGDLHAHLQKLPVRFYTQTRTGEILARVTQDVTAVQGALTNTFTEMLTNAVTLAGALGMMFLLDGRMATLIALALPLWVFPTLRVGDTMRRLQLEWRDENARMTSHLEETLSVSGSMVVKTFGRQGFESERFRRANHALRQLSIRRFMAGRWFNVSTELFGSFAVIFVYWYGARGVIEGSVPDIGTVIAFAGLSQRVFGPFRGIARVNTTALANVALFQRIFEYLDLPVEVLERADARRLERPRGSIAFEDVRFAYHAGARPAVDAISFRAEPGRTVALVGPSGAGKTTLTYLLQRFYDPDQGRVLLDGFDVRDLTLESVSRAVGAVMQETYLFHDSLEQNIRYGRLEATDVEVRAAARAAGLEELLARLPQGLQTVVGERGFRLSGGEKQRVAIARTLLKDPPVLILDEATASLDSRLEREIHEATRKLAQGRTTLVIAHRLSTVLSADEILVLDQGRIIERGTHGSLLARGGLYASLYHQQFATDAA